MSPTRKPNRFRVYVTDEVVRFGRIRCFHAGLQTGHPDRVQLVGMKWQDHARRGRGVVHAPYWHRTYASARSHALHLLQQAQEECERELRALAPRIAELRKHRDAILGLPHEPAHLVEAAALVPEGGVQGLLGDGGVAELPGEVGPAVQVP